MQEEIIEGNEQPSETSSENMGWQQFIEDRGGENSLQKDDATSQDEAGENLEQGSSEKTASESSNTNPTDLVLSKLDIDSLSQEELGELSKKLNSRTLSRFSELTARRKAAEEELNKLKSQQNQQAVPKVKNNPLADNTVEQLEQAKETAEELIEWADNVLYENEDASSHDVVAEVEGKEFTKAEVKKSLRHHKNVIEKYIPARVSDIQREGQTMQIAEAFKRKAVEELPWLKDSNNPVNKHFSAMVSDKRVKEMDANLPKEIKAQMPYLLAHAANSIYGRTVVNSKNSTVIPKKIQRQPIITPSKTSKPTVSKSDKPQNRASKVISNAMNKFAGSGDKNDFISLRTQQLTKR